MVEYIISVSAGTDSAYVSGDAPHFGDKGDVLSACSSGVMLCGEYLQESVLKRWSEQENERGSHG